MPPASNRRGRRAAALTIAAFLGAAALGACGDEEPDEALTEPEPVPITTETGSEEPGDQAVRRPPGEPEGDEEETVEEAPSDRRLALTTVRAYARALTARDGGRLCRLLTPEAFAALEPPRRRGGCAATLTASIGFEDPRGLPVFESTRLLRGDERIVVDGDSARVTATTVTQFADRELPSVEDDVVYLTREPGRRWRLAKPSALIYRAIGVADLPPNALSPP